MGWQHPGGEQVEIRLRALPDSVPFAIRLRQLLKHALRSCRLRCLGVKDLPVDAQPTPEGDRPADANAHETR
jgi:hypothetical protein